jgi:PST family polysaccharide transporter
MDTWGRQVIGFALLVVLARLLGPETFGIVGMAMLVVILATLIVQETFAEALVQRATLEPGHKDAVFALLIAVAVPLALITGLLGEPLAVLFNQPMVAELMWWLAPAVVLEALSAVPAALLRREMRFRPLALRTSVSLAAGGAVGIGMALQGQGAWGLVGQHLTQAAVQSLIVWSACGWRPGFAVRRRCLDDVVAYGVKVLGIRFLNYANLHGPRYVVGVFLGPVGVGLYQMATKLLITVKAALINPVASVAMPAAAGIQNDRERVARLMVTSTGYLALISFPTFLGLAAIAPELIPFLMGDDWSGAVPAIQILAVSGVPTAITVVNGAIMRAMNRAGSQLLLGLITLVLTFALLGGLARFGLAYVALAVLIAAWATVPLHGYVFWRATGLPIGRQLRGLVPALLASLVMAGTVLAWREMIAGELERWLLLASEVVLAVAVYALLTALIDRSTVLGLVRTVTTARR